MALALRVRRESMSRTKAVWPALVREGFAFFLMWIARYVGEERHYIAIWTFRDNNLDHVRMFLSIIMT